MEVSFKIFFILKVQVYLKLFPFILELFKNDDFDLNDYYEIDTEAVTCYMQEATKTKKAIVWKTPQAQNISQEIERDDGNFSMVTGDDEDTNSNVYDEINDRLEVVGDESVSRGLSGDDGDEEDTKTDKDVDEVDERLEVGGDESEAGASSVGERDDEVVSDDETIIQKGRPRSNLFVDDEAVEGDETITESEAETIMQSERSRSSIRSSSRSSTPTK